MPTITSSGMNYYTSNTLLDRIFRRTSFYPTGPYYAGLTVHGYGGYYYEMQDYLKNDPPGNYTPYTYYAAGVRQMELATNQNGYTRSSAIEFSEQPNGFVTNTSAIGFGVNTSSGTSYFNCVFIADNPNVRSGDVIWFGLLEDFPTTGNNYVTVQPGQSIIIPPGSLKIGFTQP